MEKPADTQFQVNAIIRQRWSPRSFLDRPVDAETLRSLFEAARWAPSCSNEQPWRFIVARKTDEAEFARLVDCLSQGNRNWAPRAPVLALAVASTVFARKDGPNRTALYDLGLAVGNLVFEATSRGLSVHQMAGLDRECARHTFGIPDTFEPVTAMAIGYAGPPEALPEDLKAKDLAPRWRRPQSEFVFAGAWGRVFEP